jgi:hypothetical protein
MLDFLKLNRVHERISINQDGWILVSYGVWMPRSEEILGCSYQNGGDVTCSLGLSATSQQYFPLKANQPPAANQQYFPLRTNQHQPSATNQMNRLQDTSLGSSDMDTGSFVWCRTLNHCIISHWSVLNIGIYTSVPLLVHFQSLNVKLA